jgi:hypothetical protein
MTELPPNRMASEVFAEVWFIMVGNSSRIPDLYYLYLKKSLKVIGLFKVNVTLMVIYDCQHIKPTYILVVVFPPH